MNPTWKLQLGAALALVGISLAWMVGPGCGLAAPVRANKPYRSSHTFEVSITTKSYRGWRDAIVMSNGKVTAVIVPSIGRVLQFGFAGEEGVFWENPELAGQPALKGDWAQTEWVNLGGDKSWPAPEADWPKFTGRKSWRPPPAFDALPVSARIVGSGGFVVLTSPVDPAYGIRVERRVRLYPGRNEMTIQTIFQKLGGEPAKVGVWVITQLREPVGVFAPLPAESTLHNGYTILGNGAPPSLRSGGGMISLLRDRKSAYKIGLDGDSLLWVGERHVLRIDSSRPAGAEYPDRGSSTEIYTNPDPLHYVELEMLGPLSILKPGEKIERSNSYTLLRRTQPTAEDEARAIYEPRHQR